MLILLFFIHIWSDFFGHTIDSLDDHWQITRREIRKWYFGAEWYEVYDFIEFVCQNLLPRQRKYLFRHYCNECMKKELSAYQFVSDRIGEITNETEISSIEESLEITSPLEGVHEHLRLASEKLTDRKNPDYRNSIKEAISAVESIACLITGNPSATLGDAIKHLKNHGLRLHPALEKAWSNLYGYTSDEGGIRHGMLEISDIKFGDAKYMLVSCSAFVNYLIQLAREIGINLEARS